MVGQGVLYECLHADDVEQVLSVGRTKTEQQHPKLKEIIRSDLFDYSEIQYELKGFDACFFCLGVSSTGMSEEKYRRVTYDLTLSAATILSQLNPEMVFTYVSGVGTDSTEKRNVMWARVKGETENDLMRLPFRGAYMFRPGFIEPVHGEKSKTRLYRVLYIIASPFMPIIRNVFSQSLLTTAQMGKAMLNAVRYGTRKNILEIPDIREISAPL